MIKRALLICCVAVLLTAFCLNSVNVSRAEKQAEQFDTVKALSDDDKLAAAVSVIYKRASDLVLTLPYASIDLSQTALMKVYSGEKEDAKYYLQTRRDAEFKNACDAMDAVLSDFDKVLSKYSVPSNSSYRTKRTALAKTFSGLKSSATELLRRTVTLINGTDSQYDSYYTAYCEQLQILSEKFEAATEQIGTEYDSLMSALLGSDYSLVS